MANTSETITLRECIDYMHSGNVFSFISCQLDKRRPENDGIFFEVAEAVVLRRDQQEPPTDETKTRKPIKKTNNILHMTRNVRMCAGGLPINVVRKIHLDLLIRFNGRKVILP